MFPSVPLYAEDTAKEVEARLIKAILDNAKKPGIKPIYTFSSVRQEAVRLHSSFQTNINTTI